MQQQSPQLPQHPTASAGPFGVPTATPAAAPPPSKDSAGASAKEPEALGPFQYARLPYATDALAPYISAETLKTHWGKHYRGYVDALNTIVKTEHIDWGSKKLTTLVRELPPGKPFNMAAQAWNHEFYFACMIPPTSHGMGTGSGVAGDWSGPKGGRADPTGAFSALIEKSFGSWAALRDKFSAAANGHFASGWVWLILTEQKELRIVETHDAECPLSKHCGEGARGTPLLACDVWEHAYYIDQKNDRSSYVKAWWPLVNWEFVVDQARKAGLNA